MINPDLSPLQSLITKGDRLFAADESQIMSRAAKVPTPQTQQSLNAAVRPARPGDLRSGTRGSSRTPGRSNFLLIVSPLVTWIWLGALIIALGGLIALWPVPAFARRRAVGTGGGGRGGVRRPSLRARRVLDSGR